MDDVIFDAFFAESPEICCTPEFDSFTSISSEADSSSNGTSSTGHTPEQPQFVFSPDWFQLLANAAPDVTVHSPVLFEEKQIGRFPMPVDLSTTNFSAPSLPLPPAPIHAPAPLVTLAPAPASASTSNTTDGGGAQKTTKNPAVQPKQQQPQRKKRKREEQEDVDQAEMDKLRQDLETNKARLTKEQIQQMQTKIRMLKNKISARTSRVRVKLALQTLETQVTELTLRNDELNSKNAQLHNEKELLVAEVARLLKENEQLKLQIPSNTCNIQIESSPESFHNLQASPPRVNASTITIFCVVLFACVIVAKFGIFGMIPADITSHPEFYSRNSKYHYHEGGKVFKNTTTDQLGPTPAQQNHHPIAPAQQHRTKPTQTILVFPPQHINNHSESQEDADFTSTSPIPIIPTASPATSPSSSASFSSDAIPTNPIHADKPQPADRKDLVLAESSIDIKTSAPPSPLPLPSSFSGKLLPPAESSDDETAANEDQTFYTAQNAVLSHVMPFSAWRNRSVLNTEEEEEEHMTEALLISWARDQVNHSTDTLYIYATSPLPLVPRDALLDLSNLKYISFLVAPNGMHNMAGLPSFDTHKGPGQLLVQLPPVPISEVNFALITPVTS